MPIQDPDIDPQNTTITADITHEYSNTVSYGSAFFDPATGQTVTQITLNSPTRSFHMEAGYDYYNRARMSSYLPDTG